MSKEYDNSNAMHNTAVMTSESPAVATENDIALAKVEMVV